MMSMLRAVGTTLVFVGVIGSSAQGRQTPGPSNDRPAPRLETVPPSVATPLPPDAAIAPIPEWPEFTYAALPGASISPAPAGDATLMPVQSVVLSPYSDRAVATRLATALGPSGPTDTGSVAWPAIASANGTVLMATNSRYRVTDRCGNTLLEQTINALVGSANSIGAPSVIYDPWQDRWAMLWAEYNFTTRESNYLLVVTTSPGNFDTATRVWYYIDADTGTGADLSFADAPRLGYGPDGLYFASDQFNYTTFAYTGSRTIIINNNVFAGALATYLPNLYPPADNVFGLYPAKMQAAAGDLDGIFIASRRAGGSDLWMMRVFDPFGTRTMTPTTIPVAAYALPPNIAQPNGRSFTRGVDCRARSAVVTTDGGLQLRTAFNIARADPTHQAMIRSHRIDVISGAVTEALNYVYGATDLAMFAPTVAATFGDTHAIGFTTSGPTFPPTPYIVMQDSAPGIPLSTPNLDPSLQGYRNSTSFGYGVGLDFDWNDYSIPGGGKRFVLLGQFGSSTPNATPTAFWSVFNGVHGGIGIRYDAPLAFRRPTGAGAFTPSFQAVTVTSTYDTNIGLHFRSPNGWIEFVPNVLTVPESTGEQRLRLYPSPAALALGPGRYTERIEDSLCGETPHGSFPVYFLVGCIADLDDGSATGTPDGGVTIDDLLYFLTLYGEGNERADIDDGSATGSPDGGVTIDDLLYFLFRFDAGC